MPCRAATLARFSARRLFRGLAAVVAAALMAAGSPTSAITLQFRYDYDATGFFGTALSPTPARTALEFAGRAFTAFTDTLAPITPVGNDSWTARVFNPSTAQQESIANLLVPANTIIVYAIAGDLAGSRLGEATRGSYGLPANPDPLSPGFIDAIVNRGEGLTTVDYAPWGGSISFDTTEPDGDTRLWHFDPQSLPHLAANDFLTVAMHELSHLMGFGFNASTSFQTQVQNGRFIGPATTALYGGSVLLQAGGDHWASSPSPVLSPPFTVDPPRAAMGPFVFPGERNALTPLDYAALDDIGWDVPPELLRLPGDADLDADVDGADLLLWQRNLGGLGGSPGDVNGDLRVDDYDGWMIQQYFGASAVPPPSLAGVPEPSALLLAAVGVSSLRRRRR